MQQPQEYPAEIDVICGLEQALAVIHNVSSNSQRRKLAQQVRRARAIFVILLMFPSTVTRSKAVNRMTSFALPRYYWQRTKFALSGTLDFTYWTTLSFTVGVFRPRPTP